MLKIIGMLCIICSTSGIGFLKGRDLVQRLEQLKCLQRFVIMLRGEINYVHTPLPEALYQISKKIENPFHDFLENVSKELEIKQGRGLKETWEKRLESDFFNTSLSKEDLEGFRNLGSQLGYLDTQMQVGTLNLYLEQLEMEIKRLDGSLSGSIKLYQSLGILAGTFVAVLMI